MTPISVKVASDQTALISCPHCGSSKRINTSPFFQKKHRLKVRCSCNNVLSVHLNFRQYFRKKTQITGRYKIVEDGVFGGGLIYVENISQTGIGFTVSGSGHNIKENMIVELKFELPDQHKSLIQRRLIVRSVRGNSIGAEFEDHTVLERALGFYIHA